MYIDGSGCFFDQWHNNFRPKNNIYIYETGLKFAKSYPRYDHNADVVQFVPFIFRAQAKYI